MITKEDIRQKVKRCLRDIDRVAESFAICCRLSELIPEAGYVLAFEPLGDEPDISPIIRDLRAENRLALIGGEHFDPRVIFHGQPDKEIALALIPGRAFDKTGHRIGRGGGTFDRTLEKFNCPKIGVAFDCQIVDKIPAEDHDVRMDRVVTASRLLDFTLKI